MNQFNSPTNIEHGPPERLAPDENNPPAHRGDPIEQIADSQAFPSAGGHWSTFLIWSQDRFTPGRPDYQRQYEPRLYGERQGSKHYWCGDKSPGDVWCVEKPRVNDLHPAMKPVALIERAVYNSGLKGERVLDLFGSSGSTPMACEHTERHARMLEIDPVYVRPGRNSTGRLSHER